MEIGDSFLPLMDSNPPELTLVEGPRGTAKTRSILSCLFAYALEKPGSKIALCRATRTRLTDTVMDTLESQVFPAFGMKVPGGAQQKNRSDYTLPNGSRFLLRGLDDTGRSQSFECSKIYLAEVSELDDMNQAIALLASTRQPGHDSTQMIMDVNPVEPQHWANVAAEPASDILRNVNVKTRADYERVLAHNNSPAKDGKWKRIITGHKDNPGYWDHVLWAFKTMGAKYIRTLEHYVGWLRKRWLDGIWYAASGQVFPEYDESFHLCSDFEPPRDWPMILGYDPGWNFTGVLWLAASPDGGIYAIDDIQEGGKSIQEHCVEINKRNSDNKRQILRCFGDPNEMFSTRSQGPSCAAQARGYGFRFIPWPADRGAAFDAGVDLLRPLLNNTKTDPPTKHYLKICERCVGLRSNFVSWAFKRTASGAVPAGAEKFISSDDHVLDPCRGMWSSGFLQRYGRNAGG